jgi:hypothetical protein
MLGDDGNQIGAHSLPRRSKSPRRNAVMTGAKTGALSIPHLNGFFPESILGWTIGANGFNAKTPRRKAAKRHRKLAGDNVLGEREKWIASRSDNGRCAMFPPSFQDGFCFGS